ncbi:MAG TPA: outer membrane protein assembly factor BamD [Kiritimatiellia bacterium]|nr:outer membrane protein assembly factor BamD [Kiritimatiellia bacterium]HSA19061.1 outer membrane protein assembly factor BamD [Kiritimatiellia bacterium]
MQSRFLKCARLTLACAIAALALAANAEKPYHETVGKKGWWFFGKTAKPTAAEQWAYADGLEQAGRASKAAKQYYRLVVRWPQAPEAGPAQLRYARWMDGRGKLLHAFDEYQRLFDRFNGQFPFDEVLDRQFEIAEKLMTTKKGRLLFFPGFAAPERAIPLFEKIIANAPGSEKAARAQLLIGRAHELGRIYEEAIASYLTTLNRYPGTAMAEEAGFHAAKCYYRLALENANDEQLMENAWAAASVFVTRYPKSEYALEAEVYRAELYDRRAMLAFRRADFYDRIAKRPEAALLAYRAFLKQFPSSDQVETARTRVEALEKKVEASHDKNS